ncbi:MAG: RsmE family RNA methyltransferase [Acidimicrobiia bacterium]
MGPAFVPAVAHTYSERLDDSIRIEGDDGHHLQRVRRLRAGEVMTVADGYGRWRVYEVVDAGEGTLHLRATSGFEHEAPLAPALAVACSLTKGDRPELVVQKLTELGVDRVVFVEAERSVVHWNESRARTAMTRLGRVAREAGAQSRRARLPTLDGPVSPRELAGHPGLVVSDVTGVTADAFAVPSLPFASHPEWLVAIGPEGGFTGPELEAFGAAPRLAVGPYVLRAETAAIAAAAALAGFRRRTPGWHPPGAGAGH